MRPFQDNEPLPSMPLEICDTKIIFRIESLVLNFCHHHSHNSGWEMKSLF